MYPKFLIFLLLVLILPSCNQQLVTNQYTADILSSDSINTLHFEKVALRIDNNETFRSYRACLKYIRNEALYLTVVSPLSKPVATFYFDSIGFNLIDYNISKKVFIDYANLSESLGFLVDFSLVQNTIFNINSFVTDTTIIVTKLFNYPEHSNNPKCNLVVNNINKFEMLDLIDTNKEILQIRYSYLNGSVLPFPSVINLKLFFKDQPMEFELAFPRKNFTYNKPITFNIDSVYYR